VDPASDEEVADGIFLGLPTSIPVTEASDELFLANTTPVAAHLFEENTC
jgi:hypothetical protein